MRQHENTDRSNTIGIDLGAIGFLCQCIMRTYTSARRGRAVIRTALPCISSKEAEMSHN